MATRLSCLKVFKEAYGFPTQMLLQHVRIPLSNKSMQNSRNYSLLLVYNNVYLTHFIIYFCPVLNLQWFKLNTNQEMQFKTRILPYLHIFQRQRILFFLFCFCFCCCCFCWIATLFTLFTLLCFLNFSSFTAFFRFSVFF